MIETKISSISSILDDENYLYIIKILDKCMTNFEQNLLFLKKYSSTNFDENYISAHIASIFNNLDKFKATNETLKRHGKVDVLISLNKNEDYIIECKNFCGLHDLDFVYKQLLSRVYYRYSCGSIVLLVNGKQPNTFKKILKEINNWVLVHKGEKIKIKNFKCNENFFVIKIKNPKTDFDMLINIACYDLEYNVNHAKKDKDIDDLYKEIEKNSKNFIGSLNNLSKKYNNKLLIEYIIDLQKEFNNITNLFNEYYSKNQKNNKKEKK
ncbi:hypothetical protein CWO85_03490 [Candidatus Phytoplasma ziziphi]|uniref:Uncharacterized protein n=1 Tax=Ziziphus jujuba witches'-broom phytoplasma TaxID=135727 RepID=A0A660HNE6_ZIZJU|nr:hypothetical protein [Candidatus Phytoplasma ziziphi]AYJ01534.1 hypothetical protein CWO85_03490 [Candidatus Phytoplasma ziziphi]